MVTIKNVGQYGGITLYAATEHPNEKPDPDTIVRLADLSRKNRSRECSVFLTDAEYAAVALHLWELHHKGSG